MIMKEETQKIIDDIKSIGEKEKLELAICLSTSSILSDDYNKKELYERYNKRLKEIDEYYRTTLVNFSSNSILMFKMAKIMELPEEERKKVALYLFNCI